MGFGNMFQIMSDVDLRATTSNTSLEDMSFVCDFLSIRGVQWTDCRFFMGVFLLYVSESKVN